MRAIQYRHAAGAMALCATLISAFAQGQAGPREAGPREAGPPGPGQSGTHQAPREVRYCTNCAVVESVDVRDAGGPGRKRYELTVRYAGGGKKIFSYENDPGLRAGENIRDNNGVLVRDVAGKSSP